MPRPRHALGRPRTEVIPHDWETTHAPVAAKTHTGTCRVLLGDAGLPPVWDDTAGSPVRPESPPVYEGSCRIQALSQREGIKLLGDQAARHMTYLVALDRDGPVPTGAVVEIVTTTDSLLPTGHRLSVGDVIRGTLTFERHLVCIDDLTQEPPEDEE